MITEKNKYLKQVTNNCNHNADKVISKVQKFLRIFLLSKLWLIKDHSNVIMIYLHFKMLIICLRSDYDVRSIHKAK